MNKNFEKIDMKMNVLGTRLLARNVQVLNDTRRTGLNNNDLVVGPSGCGKTGGYVIPNIRQLNGSMVIADTKGLLCRMLTNELEEAGYEVKVLDFVNTEKSCGYNPLDYIGRGKKFGHIREQDVVTIAETLMPCLDKHEPFWENAAKTVITCLIAFVKEALPAREWNMESVSELSKLFYDKGSRALFEELEVEQPDSYAVRTYKSMVNTFGAEKTWSSIMQFVTEALKLFDMEETREIGKNPDKIRIQELGRKKMVLFVNVSDTDRAFDNLINVFYAQAFQVLCKEADQNEDGRLKVPVRFILDDFATNVYIPNFEKLISVIRSREISVSLILQSITQLETLYTDAQAKTIINNCDHLLYLGGQDVETARYIGEKANKTPDKILNMGLNEAFLFERGELPRQVEKITPYSNTRRDVEEVVEYEENERELEN
jgi:type IV secretion system protein VirD4